MHPFIIYGMRIEAPPSPSIKHLKSLVMAVSIGSLSPMRLTILTAVKFVMIISTIIAIVMRNTMNTILCSNFDQKIM